MTFSTIFGLILLVVVILVLRKVLGAFSPGTARARSAVSRPDLSVERLAMTLQAGQLPPPVQVAFPLRPGEFCVGTAVADVEQWLEGDGAYTTRHVAWAGGLTGLAIGGTMNAIGNSRRKAAARREMAERWRVIGTYTFFVTNQRIAFDGGSGREWHEMQVPDLRRVETDGVALVLQAVGQPATRVHVAPGQYWRMLLRRLAFGE